MTAYTGETMPMPPLAAYIETTTTEEVASEARMSLLIQGVEGDTDLAALAWLLYDAPED